MLKPMVLTKLMLVGRRAPLDRTPLTIGLQYEDVVFKSTDGLDIRGPIASPHRGWPNPRLPDGLSLAGY